MDTKKAPGEQVGGLAPDDLEAAPNFADACLQAMAPEEGDLCEALARQLLRMTGVTIPADAWQEDALPAHLRMNVKVVGGDGETLVAMGRDVSRLQREQGEQAAATFAQLPSSDFEREQVTAWDFGDLPEQVEFERHGRPGQLGSCG